MTIKHLEEMLHTPLFWGQVVCSIIILLLLVAFIRRFTPRVNKTNFGKSAAPEVTVKVAPPTSTPKKATSASAASSNLLKTGLTLLPWIIGIALLIWFGQPIWKGVHEFFTTDHTPSPQSAAGMYAREAEAPEATVHDRVTAPPNENFDWEDDAKTLEGKWTPPISILSHANGERKIGFSADSSLPAPDPTEVPWVMKCWPLNGDPPFIWNGSNAVPIKAVQFASKTDKPVKVEYWLRPN